MRRDIMREPGGDCHLSPRSRPARTGQWDYYFYIDLDGHPNQPHVAAALAELREICAFFKMLGAYPVKN